MQFIFSRKFLVICFKLIIFFLSLNVLSSKCSLRVCFKLEIYLVAAKKDCLNSKVIIFFLMFKAAAVVQKREVFIYYTKRREKQKVLFVHNSSWEY